MEKLRAGAEKLGLTLTPAQLDQFQTYYEELVDWNRRFNLTSITGYVDVQLKHFLDSLTLTLVLPVGKDGLNIIDIGTGAGFPGLPLKILTPEISLTLVDSTAKKTTFLQRLVDKLRVENVRIVTARAEEAAHNPEYRESFDIALSRGVAALSTLVELTLPFCTHGGRFIAQKKEPLNPELEEADKAITAMGGKLEKITKIELHELPDERRLIVIDKVAPTPQQYPRRPGIPSKRPISG